MGDTKQRKIPVNHKSRSASFHATRVHHLKEAAEDYTELVAELIATKGEARIRDLAIALGISHVTALRTVKRLVRDGYLVAKHRGPISLTRLGQDLAERAAQRHDIIYRFLLRLGIPEKIASIDAEGIEHHVSNKTLMAFKHFLT